MEHLLEPELMDLMDDDEEGLVMFGGFDLGCWMSVADRCRVAGVGELISLGWHVLEPGIDQMNVPPRKPMTSRMTARATEWSGIPSSAFLSTSDVTVRVVEKETRL